MHERWNLAALMLDVTCFALGIACIDGSAVLPLLMQRLGATGIVIGAAAALRLLTFNGFQIFVSYALHGKPRQKPWLAFIATVTRLPLLAMPFFLLRSTHSVHARAVGLWATITILTVWTLGDGLGYVPWMEIVARAFTPKVRGRFFACSQIVSGVGSITIGLVLVRTVLHSSQIPFPRNYAVLTGLAALMFMTSLIGVFLIREPAPEEETRRELASHRDHFPTLASYFRRVPGLLRGNPVFVRLALIQLLLGFGAAASPFYVLHATHTFHIGDEWGGIYQAMQALGVIVLTPVWTYLSERVGPASAVRGLGAAVVLTPLAAMTIGGISPWLYGVVFMLMGGSLGWGMWIVMNHYLLSHVEERERPVYVALINIMFAPSALFPYIGGMLVRSDDLIQYHGVPVLLAAATAVTLIGFALALGLQHIDQPEAADDATGAESAAASIASGKLG